MSRSRLGTRNLHILSGQDAAVEHSQAQRWSGFIHIDALDTWAWVLVSALCIVTCWAKSTTTLNSSNIHLPVRAFEYVVRLCQEDAISRICHLHLRATVVRL